MRSGKFLLGRYIIKSIAPYLFLAFLIFTAVLLTQQAGKVAEALSSTGSSLSLALELVLGVLPGIVLFTLPMAVLLGTATGFARMGSDSELVVFRAVGMSNWKCALPALSLGLLCTLITTFNAFVLAPQATRSARQAVLRMTLERLETPIQPGTFNTQLPGKLIYVREGDEASGEWRKVFIHWSEPGGDLRLVTARSGRIDLTGDQTELLLHDAMVTTLPSTPSSGRVGAVGEAQVVTERSEQLRVRLNTGRAALLNQITRPDDYDEMGWGSLLQSLRTGPISKRNELLSSIHKRLALAATPIPFVLLGVGLGGRSRKGGRAFGAALAVVSMIIYYLLFLGSDYLARTGNVSPFAGAWFATLFALAAGAILVSLNTNRTFWSPSIKKAATEDVAPGRRRIDESSRRRLSFLGLLDRSIIGALVWYFVLALVGLVAVFLIFTFFETLRFVAADSSRSKLIVLYLLYLTPLATTGVTPIATLISVLVTYALMARRSEAISWWSSGQSLYRLALPSLWFVFGVCAFLWLFQERVLPGANSRQEELRSRLRSGPIRTDTPSGYLWVAASSQTLYSYKYDVGSGAVSSLTLYKFDPQGVFLEEIIRGGSARQGSVGQVVLEGVSYLKLRPVREGERQQTQSAEFVDETTTFQTFKPQLKKLSEYSTPELSRYLNKIVAQEPGSGLVPYLTIGLWKRRLDPISPLVMWINGLPLALAFGRRSAIVPLLIAVAIGVLYWLGANLFTQIGSHGLFPPAAAVVALPLLFLLTGIYFFSRAKT